MPLKESIWILDYAKSEFVGFRHSTHLAIRVTSLAQNLSMKINVEQE